MLPKGGVIVPISQPCNYDMFVSMFHLEKCPKLQSFHYSIQNVGNLDA